MTADSPACRADWPAEIRCWSRTGLIDGQMRPGAIWARTDRVRAGWHA